jgi:hypothetical protein
MGLLRADDISAKTPRAGGALAAVESLPEDRFREQLGQNALLTNRSAL